jgi:hypothetical protein
LKRDWPVLLRQWPLMLLLSATGIASYNTMSYIGLTETTALNVLLLQSAMPLVILLWAYALFRDRPSLAQSAGVLVSLGRGRNDRRTGLARGAGAPFGQSGRCLGADGDGDLRHLRGDVPPPSQGASDELPGGDDGPGIVHDPAILPVGARAPAQRSRPTGRPSRRWPTSPCSRRSSPTCSSTAASN